MCKRKVIQQNYKRHKINIQMKKAGIYLGGGDFCPKSKNDCATLLNLYELFCPNYIVLGGIIQRNRRKFDELFTPNYIAFGRNYVK